jgi:hypothetical protein
LQVDRVSARLLSAHDIVVMEDYLPRRTVADGNCFYRAISLALFGTEAHHLYLRVMTAFNVIENPAWYDVESPWFVLRDSCIQSPSHPDLVNSALTNGSYAELVHFFALSQRLGIVIQSYCIPGTHGLRPHPYTIRIQENEFQPGLTGNVLEACVMWTVAQHDNQNSVLPNPNHIVVLVPRLARVYERIAGSAGAVGDDIDDNGYFTDRFSSEPLKPGWLQ